MTNFLVNWSDIWQQVQDFFVWGPRFKLVLLIMCGVFLLAIVGLTVKEAFAPRKISTAEGNPDTEIDSLSMVDALSDDMAAERVEEILASPRREVLAGDYEVEYVDGKPVYWAYSYSFTAKLIKATDETKEYYNRIKNHILSYGAKSRMSWANESFYLGRNTYVKFGIRGKTLSAYLALDPNEFVDTKYIYENEGDVKKYELVPMRTRVKSNRGAKWACELVDILFERLGVAKKETEEQDFRPAYETTEALLLKGLIKKVRTERIPDFADEYATDEEILEKRLAFLDESADAMAMQIIEQRFASPAISLTENVEEVADAETEELLAVMANPVPTLEMVDETADDAAEEMAHVEAPAGGVAEPEYEVETVDGKQIYWLYSYSFTSKVHQATDETKDYYNTIKNHILSYGAKSRMSWPNESFYIGRTTYVKFGIRGKTLSVYMSLNPADFENTKYIYEDESGVKKYEGVPMRVRVKSQRGAKWACELLDILFANLGREAADLPEGNYRLPYRTTKYLLEKGLIKKVQTDRLPNFAEMEKDEAAATDTEASAEAEAPALEPEFEVETVGGKQIYWLYSYSFTAKVHQAANETKDYYNTIKNHILSYGAKSRMSWPNESFYIGRTTYVKFGIRGKTLSVYLALNPADFANTKYIYEDESGVKKYESVPMRVRVKSQRGAKWACELIDVLFANLGREAADLPEGNYRLPYRTTKYLLEKGLIKKVQTDRLPNFAEMKKGEEGKE